MQASPSIDVSEAKKSSDFASHQHKLRNPKAVARLANSLKDHEFEMVGEKHAADADHQYLEQQHADRNQSAPAVLDTEAAQHCAAANAAGADENDDGDASGSDSAFVAFVAREHAPVVVATPMKMMAIKSTRWLLWGALHVTIRAVRNLPSFNTFGSLNDAFATASPIDPVTLKPISACVIKTPVAKDVRDPSWETGGYMVGGVCYENHLRISVKNYSQLFGAKVFGTAQIAWRTIASLTPMTEHTVRAPLPAMPALPTTDQLKSKHRIDDLECAGVWLPLLGDAKAEAAGAAVCIVVRHVARFDETITGMQPLSLYQGYEEQAQQTSPANYAVASTSAMVPLESMPTIATPEMNSKI